VRVSPEKTFPGKPLCAVSHDLKHEYQAKFPLRTPGFPLPGHLMDPLDTTNRVLGWKIGTITGYYGLTGSAVGSGECIPMYPIYPISRYN